MIAAQTTLPRALRSTAAFEFVGRTGELAELRRLLPFSQPQNRRLALVRGAPGSGKTRLIREVAQVAATQGVRVLYGACDAVVNAPYQPFVELLEFLVSTLDQDTLKACLGTGSGELTRLLPDLSIRLDALPPPTTADPDTLRYRLHAAVVDLLARVSRRWPVLLIVDDMHWADVSSLHLLRHLARAGPQTRILLLVAFRHREADIRFEFSEALADLQRAEGVLHVQLGGLSDDEIADFVRRTARVGVEVEVASLARQIGELTGGNPFLMSALWHTLTEREGVQVSGDRLRLIRPVTQLGSPDSVRDMVRQRLLRLEPETIVMLETAAVIGPELDLRALGSAAGLGQGALLRALEEAVHSGMVEEVSGPPIIHRFAHELVRRAVYDRLTGVRRAELHLRAGEALERAHPSRPARILRELAHHFALGAAIGDGARAVGYNLDAARAAMDAFAFEDAAAGFETALRLGVDDDRERALVRLDLGLACHRAGRFPDALTAYDEAASFGRAHGDFEILARAAIGFEEASYRPGLAHDQAADLLEEAARALGDAPTSLKARTLTYLARALMNAGRTGRALSVREEAVTTARLAGDDVALGWALAQAYNARAVIARTEVAEMLRQARDLGRKSGEAELVANATGSLAVTLVEMCDLAGAGEEIDGLRRAAEETHQFFPMYIAYQHGSALALCVGDLDGAEAAAEQSWRYSRRLYGRGRSAEYGLQMFAIKREQGRLAELRPLIELMATSGERPAWRPGLAALLAELGLRDAAQAELDRLMAEGQAEVEADGLQLASLTYLTDACAFTGDARWAEVIYPRLRPLGGGTVRIGQLTACYGAADRYLGMLAATMGRWEAAEEHFARALQLNVRMGAHTWTAHTAYQYARMLVHRASPADQQRADQLRAQAGRIAQQHGLRALASRIAVRADKVGADTVGADKVTADKVRADKQVGPDGLSAREIEVLRLVSQGCSNREIGQRLFISEHTAANHVRNILRKTGSANRTDAASYAHRHGLTRP